jgi:Barstar (barnase inhibitor)
MLHIFGINRPSLLYRQPLPNVHPIERNTMTPKQTPTLTSYLQSTKPPWMSLLTVASENQAESLVRPPPGFVLKVIKGRPCATPASLFAEFARALEFPDYFGHNWDAFDALSCPVRGIRAGENPTGSLGNERSSSRTDTEAAKTTLDFLKTDLAARPTDSCPAQA